MNLFFQFSSKCSESGFFYTNSVYIPNNKKLDVQSADFLGSTGNFKDQIFQLNRGNYLCFYSENAGFSGLTVSIIAKMINT